MRKVANKSSIKDAKQVVKILSKKGILVNSELSTNGMLTNRLPVIKTAMEHSINARNADSFADYTMNRIKRMTTDFGIKQTIGIDKSLSVYSLDDNATALVVMCEHYAITGEKTDLELIDIYLNFIQHCLQPKGYFFKYVDLDKKFTDENNDANLADTTGCAIWALGYLISKKKILPETIVSKAEVMFHDALEGVKKIHSIKAISYIIKGLYYNQTQDNTIEGPWLIKKYANILVNLYKDVENNNWKWFQSSIEIESSHISEALLCAWLTTGEPAYKQISKVSFDFFLSKVFKNEEQTTFSDEEQMFKGKNSTQINTVIFSLNTFHTVFKEEDYLLKIKRSADWIRWNKFTQF